MFGFYIFTFSLILLGSSIMSQILTSEISISISISIYIQNTRLKNCVGMAVMLNRYATFFN